MAITNRRLAWGVAVALVVSSAVAVMAQNQSASQGGSLAALTAEIRQLRLAVEEATRGQTQTQALGVYLSVQQARLVEVAARVDAARAELDAVTLRSREIETRLAETGNALWRVTDPAERLALEQLSRDLKREQQSILLEQQQAQTRDMEMSQALRAEDARWTDLISRLELLIGK